VTPRGPDFLIVGAPKCGTTSLYRSLRDHPRLYASTRKEPHFFCDVLPPHFRSMDADAYFALFADAPESSLAFEASTNYVYSEAACRRIRDHSRDSRIIVILRDPVARAYSEYWHFRRYGMEPLSFEECIATDGEREVSRRYHERGLYSRHIERYLDTFGEGQVHVLLLDDLARDATATHAGICAFLGVDARALNVDKPQGQAWAPRWRRAGAAYGGLVSDRTAFTRFVRGATPRWARRPGRAVARALLTTTRVPPMAPETRARLRDGYAAEVSRLESVLRRDLTAWRT
jgi:hypothetical protein